MQVIKADGSIQVYQESKVTNSIHRAGIPRQLQQKVLDHINSKMYDNIPTSEIYHHILEYLDTSPEPFVKTKYSLKQAIMQLGPTGYPFEDFIAKLLSHTGYDVLVRQVLLGKCVNHEIDVIAEKKNNKIMIEAKFHNDPGTKSEVHVPLYVHSRFEDIKMKYGLSEAWIVTNTKATSDAIAYSICSGMKIMSWSYPMGESLRDIIEASGLHPITILSTLSIAQKTTLLNNHIVLCKDITDDERVLDYLHLPHEQKTTILSELAFINTYHLPNF